MFFDPAHIDATGTPGRNSDLLYRRVKLDTSYPGIVRYPKELEAVVNDVRAYIAEWLDEAAVKRGLNVVAGRLYSPVDVPLPGQSREWHVADERVSSSGNETRAHGGGVFSPETRGS